MSDSDSFRMPVSDVSHAKGRGLIVTGWVEKGTIKVDDEVEILSSDGTKRTTKCLAVETFNKAVPEARAGKECSILLCNTQPGDVSAGAILAAPGTSGA